MNPTRTVVTRVMNIRNRWELVLLFVIWCIILTKSRQLSALTFVSPSFFLKLMTPLSRCRIHRNCSETWNNRSLHQTSETNSLQAYRIKFDANRFQSIFHFLSSLLHSEPLCHRSEMKSHFTANAASEFKAFVSKIDSNLSWRRGLCRDT